MTRWIRGGMAVLATLVIFFVAATPAQAFPGNHFSGPKDGWFFYISNSPTGFDGCMDVKDAQSAVGTRIQQWHCIVAWNQQFQTVKIGTVNGVMAWRLKPRFAQDKCVRIKDAGASNLVELGACNSYDWEQMFQIEWEGAGTIGYRIKPVFNHWCLSPTNYDEGAPIIMHPCDYSDSIQIWRLSY